MHIGDVEGKVCVSWPAVLSYAGCMREVHPALNLSTINCRVEHQSDAFFAWPQGCDRKSRRCPLSLRLAKPIVRSITSIDGTAALAMSSRMGSKGFMSVMGLMLKRYFDFHEYVMCSVGRMMHTA